MRAIAITGWGGPERLELAELPVPPVGPDVVLVRVRAAGVNPVDAKIRRGSMEGRIPHEFPLVPGWDLAGVVEEVGPAVTTFRPGDEVYGYVRLHHLRHGTYAELAIAPESYLAHKPRELSFEEAAALPLAGLTAFQAIDRIGVRGGESFFVTGGAGGVGHLAVQMGAARGTRVVATASPENHAFLNELGAEAVDYHELDVAHRVREMLSAEGADAALDLFGGEAREQALASVRTGGRLVSIASPPPGPCDGIETSYIFVRPSGYLLAELSELVTEGLLRPHVEAVLPLDEAAEAHRRIEAGHVRGKLVLRVAGP